MFIWKAPEGGETAVFLADIPQDKDTTANINITLKSPQSPLSDRYLQT
jgi:hypothetical protein